MKTISMIAIATGILVAGCAKGPTVAGSWTVTDAKNMPPGSAMVLTFTEPDQMKMTIDFKQQMPGSNPIEIHGEVTGTYKLEGENMTMKASDVKFSGTGIPAQVKAMADAQMSDMSKGLKEEINKDGASKFKWVNDDSFTMTGKGGTQTFTRKK